MEVAMNRICLTGRVIADPELRTLGERMVATVPVSVNRPYKRKDAPYPESDVFRVDVWGSRGESLVNHVSKGDQVWVTGRVELRKAEGSGYYVDVRDGEWGFVGPRPTPPEHEESEEEVAPPPKAPARSGKK
jgi:single-stranded DNA-binding protein